MHICRDYSQLQDFGHGSRNNDHCAAITTEKDFEAAWYFGQPDNWIAALRLNPAPPSGVQRGKKCKPEAKQHSHYASLEEGPPVL